MATSDRTQPTSRQGQSASTDRGWTLRFADAAAGLAERCVRHSLGLARAPRLGGSLPPVLDFPARRRGVATPLREPRALARGTRRSAVRRLLCRPDPDRAFGARPRRVPLDPVAIAEPVSDRAVPGRAVDRAALAPARCVVLADRLA